jgi:hypothetical protein
MPRSKANRQEIQKRLVQRRRFNDQAIIHLLSVADEGQRINSPIVLASAQQVCQEIDRSTRRLWEDICSINSSAMNLAEEKLECRMLLDKLERTASTLASMDNPCSE